MNRARAPLLFLPITMAAIGCEDASPEPLDSVREPALPVPVVHETRYATVAIGEGKPRMCGGTLGRTDRHIETVASILDVEPEPIEIYWYEPEPSSGRSAAYFDHAAIVSDHRSLLHELVHAVSIPTMGRSDKMFVEGIANAYEESNTELRFSIDFDISAALGTESRGSGHFTRWLIETYGSEPFKALFDRPTPTTAEILARIEDGYGMTLEELEVEFFANAPAWYSELGTCDGLERFAWPDASERFAYQTVGDCGASNAFGFTGDSEHPYFMAVVLELPSELVGREFTAPIVLPDSTGNLAAIRPCSIGEGPPGEAINPPFWTDGGLSEALVGNFQTTAYRLDLPFAEDGDAVAVEIQLRPEE